MLAAPLLVLIVGVAQTVSAANIIKERVASLPEGWQLHGDVPELSETLSLSIALRQAGIEALKARLTDISNPIHPDYGFHLTQKETLDLRAPRKEHAESVLSWLESRGIVNAAISHDWIHFNATVDETRAILDADVAYYSYRGRRPVLRARKYAIPAVISEAVDFVHPITNFMPPKDAKAKVHPIAEDDHLATRQDLPCSGGTNPGCIRELYNLRYTAPAGKSPVRFGIAGFLDQFINYADTEVFMNQYAADIAKAGYNFTVELVNNGFNPQIVSRAGLEASLDVQYAMALGYPTNVVYYSTGGRGIKLDENGQELPVARTDNEPYVEFIEYLLAKPDADIPHVISISYADDEQSVPAPYALRVCDMLAALAARGVTILSASGDGGARGTGQSPCLSNDGQKRQITVPTFPASCPYVTTVGATVNGRNQGASYSTGGFSNLFPTPDWQKAAVTEYVEILNQTLAGRYNVSGRAIPDISAVGSAFAIEWAGGPSSVLGTSASTPVVAAMMALVNDARLRAGKNATGWINPLLYSDKMTSVLQDIVEGVSQSCIWDGSAPGGWPAASDYDCITGLGVPNDFEKFLGVFMSIA
jgi:tripeptidyl-peptidase I